MTRHCRTPVQYYNTYNFNSVFYRDLHVGPNAIREVPISQPQVEITVTYSITLLMRENAEQDDINVTLHSAQS